MAAARTLKISRTTQTHSVRPQFVVNDRRPTRPLYRAASAAWAPLSVRAGMTPAAPVLAALPAVRGR